MTDRPVAHMGSYGGEPTVVHSTPAAAVKALISACGLADGVVERFSGVVWEPAVGSGALVDALEAHLPDGVRPARIVATDIVARERATYGPADFTRLLPPAGGNPAARPRVIVTNPPFRLATKFMTSGLRWLDGVSDGLLALFLPLGALAGQERAKGVFASRPPTMIVAIANRMTIFPDGHDPDDAAQRGKGTVEYCWLVWLNGPAGAPMTDLEAAAARVPRFCSISAV